MNINRVVLTGNLTKDPGLAFDARRRTVDLQAAARGQHPPARTTPAASWEEKPNYFDVTVFGRQAENCGQYLSKGRPVAIDGRLEWSECEVDGQKRQSVDIIADNVQFLGGRDDAGNGNGNGSPAASRARRATSRSTPAISRPRRWPPELADDDIPF